MNLVQGKTYKIHYGRDFHRLGQYVRDRTWTIGFKVTARYHMFRVESDPIEMISIHSDRLEVWVSDS